VDDLTRPTPADRVMPFLLSQFADAGISAQDVTVVMGSGTHGRVSQEAIATKVGGHVGALIPHEDTGNLVRVGRTSFGTPVIVNREVAASDLVVGIGGIFPNFSTGFGGGSKLALGVLGRRSISRLHFGHRSMSGNYSIDNNFRRDLDEIATLVGLDSTISLHVDAYRRLVRIVSGDHRVYYKEAVDFSKEAFAAPGPGSADVVIANAYPFDTSLHFTRSKGRFPLTRSKPSASRVLISACSEGVGHHGLFPYEKQRFHRQRKIARTVMARPGAVPAKIKRRAKRKVATLRGGRVDAVAARADERVGDTPAGGGGKPAGQRDPVWLFVSGDAELPSHIPGVRAVRSWSTVLEAIDREQGDRETLEVAVYPCSPLQILAP
ncbi:MAG: lactate racemase domain-containing protein, partial [Actinomycetota bacterium]|nr:lactate racemase domain-containing protein [Actinomycetota bacterium]